MNVVTVPHEYRTPQTSKQVKRCSPGSLIQYPNEEILWSIAVAKNCFFLWKARIDVISTKTSEALNTWDLQGVLIIHLRPIITSKEEILALIQSFSRLKSNLVPPKLLVEGYSAVAQCAWPHRAHPSHLEIRSSAF